ncbi:U3 small nucleolar ribonucleoprotein complex, subunit Mpp10 [Irpex rosettiformis]|uniref:U3 small nucleolar ribonucleoprotein complex, subunit Mpp10 n=1 Tax=Irpex rosettiformis TaxID=378272 RepID=A0ACB8UKR1_9APHY|nr:U3 small nucleolar ribonucleoprotein complex, subunit Mpp10 [Irpex rosettiformis]
MSFDELSSASVELEELEVTLPDELATLSTRIDDKPESLATGNKDIQLAALQAAKYVFDRALKSEASSRAQIATLLSSLSPAQAPQTRSQANKGANVALQKTKQGPTFEDTPLPELCIDSMDEGQVWAQMELRAQKLCKVLEYALEGTGELAEEEDIAEEKGMKKRGVGDDDMNVDEENDDTLEDDFEDESDDWDSEVDGDDDEDEGGHKGMEESSEGEYEGEESVLELRDPSDGEGDFVVEGEPVGPPRKKQGKGKRGGHSALDDGFFDLAAFNAETEEAEARKTSRGRLSRDDDEDDSDAELEDVDIFAPVDGIEVDEEQEPFYKDFFAPPSRAPVQVPPKRQHHPPQPAKAKTSVRFDQEVRVKKIKPKGKNLPVATMYQLGVGDGDEDDDFGEELSLSDTEDVGSGDDEDEQDEDEEVGSRSDAMDDDSSLESEGFNQREAIERLKNDLFADDEDEDISGRRLFSSGAQYSPHTVKPGLSTYEKRRAAIQEEITSLESENVAQKHWTLMGEATSKSRPQNALLEEDLEFERIMKSVPVITEETVQGLEERIKTRIVENRFDDVVRKRPVDDKPFLPSRFFELQDTKSKQSLAEIYEDEYTKARAGQSGVDDRDGKLAKEHEEISALWENICSKLDALCNAHFTPKAPKASISTIANVSATSLESALPTTLATSTMLAPEEVFTPSSSDLRARSELNPTQKRALHNKEKKFKKKQRDALEKSVDKFAAAGKRGSVKKQKENALKSVVKNGKGITVIGKKSKDHETKSGKSR